MSSVSNQMISYVFRLGTQPVLRPGALVGERVLSSRATQAQPVAQEPPPPQLKTTPLHDFHLKHGGKMVPFAGYSMPVQYADQSIGKSHLHTRRHASIFDVSHMCQIHVGGKGSLQFLERLTPSDLVGMKRNNSTLSVLLNPQGGIIDDLIITKLSDEDFYIVCNAANADKDLNHLRRMSKECGKADSVSIDVLSQHHALIALQGPEAAAALKSLVTYCQTDRLAFMSSRVITVAGLNNVRLTRCGYTGEDGYELSVDNSEVQSLVEALLDTKVAEVKLAGLGARDTLRLEAGLCLYGHDISEETTPVEAGLTWVVHKRRRQGDAANFLGSAKILAQIKDKSQIHRKRVGLRALLGHSTTGAGGTGPAAREGARVLDPETGNHIGTITSGCPSPSLRTNISMAYVDTTVAGNDPFRWTKSGAKVKVEIRNRTYDYEVTRMPFIATRYYTG